MNNYRNYGLAMLSLFFLTLSISSSMGQDTSENNYPGGATMIQPGQAIQDSIRRRDRLFRPSRRYVRHCFHIIKTVCP